MDNVVVNVTLPMGLALTDGRTLKQDMTFDIISILQPYYASVDEVKLIGGQILRKLSDITIACAVYHASTEAKLITPVMGELAGELLSPFGFTSFDYNNMVPISSMMRRFKGARNHYTANLAARDLIMAQMTLLGNPAAHVLANFSVTRNRSMEGEGANALLKKLDEDLKFYEITIRSGGKVMPGGRPQSGFSAKGIYDWTERTPSRTWLATGLGANATSWDFGSPTGGRGKPVKFFAAPFYSPPLVNLRAGIFQGTYPLVIMSAYPTAV